MMLPIFLNQYMILQVLFGHVDNQKRVREYSYPLVQCIFRISSLQILNLQVVLSHNFSELNFHQELVEIFVPGLLGDFVHQNIILCESGENDS